MSIPGNWALNRSIQNTDALYAFKGGEFGKAVGIRDWRLNASSRCC